MSDEQAVQELIAFVEEKEKEYQSQQLVATGAQARTSVINSIVTKVKECIKE